MYYNLPYCHIDPYYDWLVVGLIILPLLGCLVVLLTSTITFKLVRFVSNLVGICTFLIAIVLFTGYSSTFFMFDVISLDCFIFNVSLDLGIDAFSLLLILLSCFITCLCLLASWINMWKNESVFFHIAILAQSAMLNLVFLVLDIFYFYIFFEATLITMVLIMGFFGSRERKIRATFLLLIYTVLGSILMLLSILYLYVCLGTTNYIELLTFEFSKDLQCILWVTFFLAFAVKVPMVPLHVWLPEAHVEAPTVGSVILAGVLLKLGTFGFLRYCICLLPNASLYFAPFIYTLSIISLFYASICAICQTDIKRVIAYSSIAHMNLIMLGLFSFDVIGLEGCFLQMLNHGIVSGGLFLLVGVLYDRYHTRLIKYYGGLVHVMPFFTFFFLIFILANIAIPGTCSFVGEFLVFLGLFEGDILVTVFAATGMILGGIYSLWLFNRICFGNLNCKFITVFYDMTKREIFLFIVLMFIVIWVGIFPSYFIDFISYSCGCVVFFIISHC